MVQRMISPKIWKTVAEYLQDILIALEKNERIGEDVEMVQTDIENLDSIDRVID